MHLSCRGIACILQQKQQVATGSVLFTSCLCRSCMSSSTIIPGKEDIGSLFFANYQADFFADSQSSNFVVVFEAYFHVNTTFLQQRLPVGFLMSFEKLIQLKLPLQNAVSLHFTPNNTSITLLTKFYATNRTTQ